MSEIRQETLDLINNYKIEMAAKRKQYQQQTIDRFEPVMSKPKTKKGKTSVTIDIPATTKRLIDRVGRYSVVLCSQLAGTVASIYCFTILIDDHQFKGTSNLVPLGYGVIQQALKLDTQLIEWRISTHAVARFLERNNTTDIDHALFILGNAITDSDRKIGKLANESNLKVVGYCERQVICKDDGVAMILIHDPSDEDYRTTQWDLVTYISKEQRRHWNDEAAAMEFETLRIREFPLFIRRN